MATLGLLIDEVIVVVGAMLVAPLLFPILSLAMGIVTSSRLAVFRSIKVISRSVGLIFVISLITSFLFQLEPNGHLLDQINPNLISFLVSFAVGLAVTFTWVRKDLSAILPGIAVSASLIVPLVALGIGSSLLDRSLIANSLSLFAVNLLSIVLAAGVIFSLFGFSDLQDEEEKKIAEKDSEEKVHREAIEEAAIFDGK